MRTTFITSAPALQHLPALELPEVAFLGRSNVGKSTLLNALVNARIARTSSTPGRTQAVNLFRVHAGFGDFVLADLPGFGYAKVPRSIKKAWGPLTDGYVQSRAELKGVVLLFDSRRDVRKEDVAMFARLREALEDHGAEAKAVLSNIDKLPKAKRKPRIAEVAGQLGIERHEILAVSSSERIGLEELTALLAGWVGEAPPAHLPSSR